MYHEQRYQTGEVYVSKQIEVDMLLSFTLAKHQLTSQVSFGGERTLVESLTTPTYVGTSYYTTHTPCMAKYALLVTS